MHIVEELFLNPFEKWVFYGRFPCKFVVHLILSVVVTAQAVIYFQRDIEHVSRTNQHFVHMFTSGDPLHSPYALQDGVASLITNHFLINNRSIVRYQLHSPNELILYLGYRNGERGEVRVNAKEWIDSFNKQQHLEYLEVIFPLLFDLDDLPILREIKAYQRMDEVGYSCKEASCQGHGCIYHWELVTSFDGRAAGDFITLLDAKAVDCQGKEWQTMHWISISVALLALLSLGLVCRKVRRSLKVINQFRASSQTWARLTYSDIASMLSIWLVQADDVDAFREAFRSSGVSELATWLTAEKYDLRWTFCESRGHIFLVTSAFCGRQQCLEDHGLDTGRNGPEMIDRLLSVMEEKFPGQIGKLQCASKNSEGSSALLVAVEHVGGKPLEKVEKMLELLIVKGGSNVKLQDAQGMDVFSTAQHLTNRGKELEKILRKLAPKAS
eukprot:symbB.v1.2.014406.t1/scaffold1050.1/size141785/4